jgi:oleate hydratase
MKAHRKAFLIGGGIGSMAAAAFMIRDGGMLGDNISIFESDPVLGGSLDGCGDPVHGYSMRGGRMLTTDNYECTWDLIQIDSVPASRGQVRFRRNPRIQREAQSALDGAAC